MTTTTIKTIIAVSKYKSFQEAAYYLNFSPAAVSKQIASAEKELGVKLFVRGNKAFSAFCTPECESIIYNLTAMNELWEKTEHTLEIMKNLDENRHLRIGVSYKRWSCGEEDIIVNFIMKHPEVNIEQMHGYINDLLINLRAGSLDGVFVTVYQSGSGLDFIDEFKTQNECEFILAGTINSMYLGISESSPLANAKNATFADFKDYEIVFNSDRMSRASYKSIEPFIELSGKYGFKMKTAYLDTCDTSTYRLATCKKLAIPMPNNNFSFPGLRFVRLCDWESYVSTYFVTMKRRNKKSLRQFKSAVADFCSTTEKSSVT